MVPRFCRRTQFSMLCLRHWQARRCLEAESIQKSSPRCQQFQTARRVGRMRISNRKCALRHSGRHRTERCCILQQQGRNRNFKRRYDRFRCFHPKIKPETFWWAPGLQTGSESITHAFGLHSSSTQRPFVELRVKASDVFLWWSSPEKNEAKRPFWWAPRLTNRK